MRRSASGANGGFSDLLKEFARRIAEADGVVPLKPGEVRPDWYYFSDIFTIGRKSIDMSKPAPPPKQQRDKR